MLTQCIWCHNEPIKTKKNSLGAKCQLLFYKHGTLDYTKASRVRKTYYTKKIWTETGRKATTIKNLINNHGIEILHDIILLSQKPFWNLTELAKKYGFSRERARQIHLKLTGKAFQATKTKTRKRTGRDIGCPHDPRYKVAEYSDGGYLKKAARIELLFLRECQKRDIPVEIPCTQEVDIKVNGFWVDVKSCHKLCVTGRGQRTKYRKFRVSKKQMIKAKYIACYHKDRSSFYIIPTDDVPKGRDIYIGETATHHPNSKDRYEKYKDAWHLLQTAPNPTNQC